MQVAKDTRQRSTTGPVLLHGSVSFCILGRLMPGIRAHTRVPGFNLRDLIVSRRGMRQRGDKCRCRFGIDETSRHAGCQLFGNSCTLLANPYSCEYFGIQLHNLQRGKQSLVRSFLIYLFLVTSGLFSKIMASFGQRLYYCIS